MFRASYLAGMKADSKLLRDFLKRHYLCGVQVMFEFRNESWFVDEILLLC